MPATSTVILRAAEGMLNDSAGKECRVSLCLMPTSQGLSYNGDLATFL
jgi:hypothetical protein